MTASHSANGLVLLIEDDADLRAALSQGLELEGLEVEECRHAEEALQRIRPDFPGIVVSDIRMPGIGGMQLLRQAMEIDAALPVILITGHGDVSLAVEAMRTGAYDFLEKPFPPSRLADMVLRAIEKRRLVLENRALREGLPATETLSGMLVGGSRAIQRLRAEVLAVAQADADVLLTGETGSGKELVSRAIHKSGPRADGPFVAINCGALPENLIESELFGHEKGAFTGAHDLRIGKLEHANGGTVLLDEIESMPMELQVRLLRVLEERSVERLGSNRPRPVDLRFIAASKEDLGKAARQGRFRPDLYYRLSVVNIAIPPLRDRREDIPELVWHLARLARSRYRKEIPPIPQALLTDFQARDWPGNVRELRNEVDRFVLGLSQPRIPDVQAGGLHSLQDALAAYEKNLISEMLERNSGKLKPTYEALGISRKTLYDKMRRHGLHGEDG